MIFVVPDGPNQNNLVNVSLIRLIRATQTGIVASNVQPDGSPVAQFRIPVDVEKMDDRLSEIVTTVSSIRRAAGHQMITLPNGDAIDPTLIGYVGKSTQQDAEHGVYIRGTKDNILLFIPTSRDGKEVVLEQIKALLIEAQISVASIAPRPVEPAA